MKSYLQGLITGIILSFSALLFMGSQFGGFKNINDVYSLVAQVQKDIDYIKKWGLECNGGTVECD